MGSKIGASTFFIAVVAIMTYAMPPDSLKIKDTSAWPSRSLGAAAEEVLKAE